MIFQIKDLNEGITEFNHTVPSENYDLSEKDFYPNSLNLKIYVDRLENLFRFKISVSTKAAYVCDRCLESFDLDYNEKIEQIYQLGHSDLDGDEIEIVSENSKEIDISKAIYDLFMINRPIQLLCRNDCKGLCVNCGVNLNKQKCDCQQEEIDPRLEKLKNLLK
jgi:uncharacterized protein